MPISIVCPGCKARFSVSDQFAGRTGPCPKCKQPITIPKPAAQSVVIHEPDAPVSSSGQTGRAPTAPLKSRDKPVKISAIAASAAGAAGCLALAAVLPRIFPPGEGGATTIPSWLLLSGAFAVALPCVTLAYAAVRNRELEALQGMEFAKRAVICSLVYAALWGLRGILPAEQTAEMWQWFYIGPLFVTAGSLAAFASLDLDQGGAIAHYSFYVLFCSLLRWMAGLLPLEEGVAMTIDRLPELVALDTAGDGVRIPPGDTVPLTPRVRALIDTPPLRRLTRISQLGLVSLVYPGATHSRFEHSLGVYRLALEFLRRLRSDSRFTDVVSERDASAFVVAAILHDAGHWAYCHPIEDMGLPEIPSHESRLPEILTGTEVAAVLANDWRLDASRVASLIAGNASDPAGRLLQSLLSGPIDVDKMDYLARDSLHAGVPYGRHFDQERLLASLCLDADGQSLAITSKGRTAAELMVFARYVMFSEVYWHHAVRAATAMLQRAIWIVRPSIVSSDLVRMDDQVFEEWLAHAALDTPVRGLVDGLFGLTRRLFKRVAHFDARHSPEVHKALAGRSYAEMVVVPARLADALTVRLNRRIAPETLIVDAPPREREVEFRLWVRESSSAGDAQPHSWLPLEALSPVVRSLAHEQFDALVKRVRVFAPPEDAHAIAAVTNLDALVLDAAAD